MTNAAQKYADAQYASTVGLLVLPAVLVLSRPFGGAPDAGRGCRSSLSRRGNRGERPHGAG
jgi:hypothetical protein